MTKEGVGCGICGCGFAGLLVLGCGPSLEVSVELVTKVGHSVVRLSPVVCGGRWGKAKIKV